MKTYHLFMEFVDRTEQQQAAQQRREQQAQQRREQQAAAINAAIEKYLDSRQRRNYDSWVSGNLRHGSNPTKVRKWKT